MKIEDSYRVLYVSAFSPDINSPHGGGQSAYYNIKEIKETGAAVDIVICTTEHCTSVYENFIHQSFFSLILGWLHNIFSRDFEGFLAWPFLNTRSNFKLHRLLNKKILTNNYDLIFIEFTQAFLPAYYQLKKLNLNIPIHLCISDLFSQKLIRRNSIIANLFIGLILRYEKFIFSKCQKVITLNEKDSNLIHYLFDFDNVQIRKYYPPEWTRNVIRHHDSKNIIFFGNFKRFENFEALNWFLSGPFINIRKRIPDLKLYLVGDIDLSLIPHHAAGGVEFFGFVKDPSSLFSKSKLTIAPLKYGAGIKYKVLDSLSAQIPVLGTNVAFEGICKSPLTFESDRDNFERVLLSLLKKP